MTLLSESWSRRAAEAIRVMPPIGIAAQSMVVSGCRHRSLAEPETMAIMLGTAAPKPRPVAIRIASSQPYPGACGVSTLKRPGIAVAPVSVFTRPKRSPSRPPGIARTKMPNRLALNSQPSALGTRSNACATRGAAAPMDWMS